MDALNEQELTRELHTGNADAWRALYDAHAEPIWRFVARLLGSGSADVADVVQETFLAAARSARTFDASRGTIWLWLCGIARRQVALHYRKEERHDRIRKACQWLAEGNGRVARWLENREPLPADALATSELTTLVRATLTELSDEYGSLLAIRYLDGIPVEQIADSENSSATAIRSRLARARRAFRDVFLKFSTSPLEH